MGNKHNKIENKNLKNKKEKEQIKKQEIVESNKKDIYKYNILFIGESGVGTKTSLIKRIIEGKFIDVKNDYKETKESLKQSVQDTKQQLKDAKDSLKNMFKLQSEDIKQEEPQ